MPTFKDDALPRSRSIRELGGEIWAELSRQMNDDTIDWRARSKAIDVVMGVLARHSGSEIVNDIDLPVEPSASDRRRRIAEHDVNDVIAGREFQTWSFVVSHGRLLVRSPGIGGEKCNVDIVFVGTQYMSLPRHLPNLRIDDPTAEELSSVKSALGELGRTFSVLTTKIMVVDGIRHPVASVGHYVETNDLEIFENPHF